MSRVKPVSCVLVLTGLGLVLAPPSVRAVGLLLYAAGWVLWGATAAARVRHRMAGERRDGETTEEADDRLSLALRRQRLWGGFWLALGASLSSAAIIGLLGIPIVLGGFLACVSTSIGEPARRQLGRLRRVLGAIVLVVAWLAASGTAMGMSVILSGRDGSSMAAIGLWIVLAPALVAVGSQLRSALTSRERLARGAAVAGLFLFTAALRVALIDVLPRSL